MSTAPLPRPLGEARSFLFVPGDRPERLAKALTSAADAVILDLEDAVAPAAKPAARAALAQGWPSLSAAERQRLLVRVNAVPTPGHGDDLTLLEGLPGLAGVMLAKAESAAQLQALAAVHKS